MRVPKGTESKEKKVKKKLILVLSVIVVLVSVFAMAGCQNKAANGGDGGSKAASGSGDAYEYYTNAQKAMTASKGYTMDMKMEMKMSLAGQSMDIPIESKVIYSQKSEKQIEMKMTQKTSVMGQTMDSTVYYKDGFVYTETAGQKVKMATPMESLINGVSSPEIEKDAIKDSSVEKVSGGTKIKLTIDGKSLDSMVNQVLQSMAAAGASEDSMSFGDAKFSGVVDSDGMLSEMSMEMTYAIEIEGEKSEGNIKLTMKNIKFGDQTVDFPKDLDTYQDMSEADTGGTTTPAADGTK